MKPALIIGRRLFVDGIVGPIFIDDGGTQYVIDRNGSARLYGVSLNEVEAVEPITVKATDG